MTVIAAKGNEIASDTSLSNELDVHIGDAVKFYYCSSASAVEVGITPMGCVIGVSGVFPDVGAAIIGRHTASGLLEVRPKLFGDTDLISVALCANGEIFFGNKGNFATVRSPNGETYAAIGSGSSVAMGAMWAGASATEAVEAAIHLAPCCAGSVVSFSASDIMGWECV